MNLSDRYYLSIHVALTVLVCARYPHVAHAPWYLAWNALAISAVLLLARKPHDGTLWEFAHDWLPAFFFITVFEEVSFLSLACAATWQNPLLVAWESALFAVPPARVAALLVRRRGFASLLEFGYFTFYPLYPWSLERCGRGATVRFAGAFRRLTDGLSVG